MFISKNYYKLFFSFGQILISLSYADEFFCEGESYYDIRVSEGELIQEKI